MGRRVVDLSAHVANGYVLTQGYHQEAHVVEPVGGFVGQLCDKELQDGPEVALTAHHRHLHRPGHRGVTVTAKSTAGS